MTAIPDPDALPDPFYAGIPVFRGFASLMDPTLYRPLPADWIVGVADIVNSTGAIRDDRYKTVNMAGAAVIAAVKNALGGRDFPYVFGGDGASFAVSPADLPRAGEALAATAAWTGEELELEMRTALVPVAAIRAAGPDVTVARFAPSANVSFAMFAGGGLAWADAAMRRGAFTAPVAPAGARPDLTGLTCSFDQMVSVRGVILSLIIAPQAGAQPAAFRDAIEAVVHMVEASPGTATPVPAGGPPMHWPPPAVELEARARDSRIPLAIRRIGVLMRTLVAYAILRFRITVGRFVPATYLREVVENSDFRKFDDGLRMTLDCTPELADTIEARLAAAASQGIIRYGTHRQTAALMTCFTPSPMEATHVHFIDGASGGYAAAAAALKAASA